MASATPAPGQPTRPQSSTVRARERLWLSFLAFAAAGTVDYSTPSKKDVVVVVVVVVVAPRTVAAANSD